MSMVNERRNSHPAQGLFLSAFNVIDDGVLIIGKKSEILYANRQVRKLSGYTKKALFKLTITDILKLHENGVFRSLNGNQTKGSGGLVEGVCVNRKGKTIPVSVSHKVLRKKSICILIIRKANDSATRGMKKDQTEERLSAQYQAMPVPTFTWQKTRNDFVMIDYNDAGNVLSQKKAHEFLGKSAKLLFGNIRPDIIYDFKKCFKNRKVIKREMSYRRLIDGEDRVYAVTYAYVPKDFILFHAEDITERKRAEKALIESEEKLRVLSSHLLSAQEAERRRFAIEMHDEVGQALILLKFQIARMLNKLTKRDNELRAKLQRILQCNGQLIENVRRISRGLIPVLLEDSLLSDALRDLIREFALRYKVKTHLSLIYIDELFSRESQINIYRIFQETLSNVAKHSRARNVTIRLMRKSKAVLFMIEDDGRGFNVDQHRSSISTQGVGLTAMKERTIMLGGTLEVRSKLGRGTEIRLKVPIVRE